jgi:hypothetical protein
MKNGGPMNEFHDTVKLQEPPLRTITLALFLALSGCATLSSGNASNSGDAQSQLTVPVNTPPPADKNDGDKPAAPGFGYIWVAGYWDYLDGNYIWRAGRWVQGKADYEYVRARYEFDGKAWVFHRPHWKRRHATTPQSAGTTGQSAAR